MKYIKDFERSTALLVEMFCKKQELDLDYIASVTGVYTFDDNSFTLTLSDIYFDMVNEVPKGTIIEWQNYLTDLSMKGIDVFINYESYIMGYRHQENEI